MINSRSLNDLNPYVKSQYEKALVDLKKQGIEILTVSTLRDQEYQTKLYNQGRTDNKAIVTNMKLIGPHGFGLALDLVPMVNGKCAWDRSDLYAKIAIVMKKYGFEWGGDWKSFPDKPHFQMTQGLTAADLRAGKYPKFEKKNDLILGLEWLKSKNIITDIEYWTQVAEGNKPCNSAWLKIIFERLGRM